MNEILDELENVQLKCEKMLKREATPDETRIIGLVFELGRQYGLISIVDEIQKKI